MKYRICKDTLIKSMSWETRIKISSKQLNTMKIIIDKIICNHCGSHRSWEHYNNWAVTGAVIVQPTLKCYCNWSCFYLSQPHPTSLWDTKEEKWNQPLHAHSVDSKHPTDISKSVGEKADTIGNLSPRKEVIAPITLVSCLKLNIMRGISCFLTSAPKPFVQSWMNVGYRLTIGLPAKGLHETFQVYPLWQLGWPIYPLCYISACVESRRKGYTFTEDTRCYLGT